MSPHTCIIVECITVWNDFMYIQFLYNMIKCQCKFNYDQLRYKQAFLRRRELLSTSISISLRKRLVKSLVWSVTLYGCETWTLRKDDCKRLEAFEMWIWRRMFKIKWIERLSNEEVLVIAGETRSLLNTIKDRHRKWIGHVLRHDNMMRDMIEGRVDGKRMRGGQRTKMLDMIMNGNTYKATKIKAQDRNEWYLGGKTPFLGST